MGLDYVREEEIAAIPVMQHKLAHALYGPLADFPVQPEVVLVFAHAQHGLILSEAVARVDGGTPPAMGRPACAIVPHVLNQRRAAMSLGCCGARAYLDALTDDVALWALPAHCLDSTVSRLPHSLMRTGRSRRFISVGGRMSSLARDRRSNSRSSGCRSQRRNCRPLTRTPPRWPRCTPSPPRCKRRPPRRGGGTRRACRQQTTTRP